MSQSIDNQACIKLIKQLKQFGNLDIIGGKDCNSVTKIPAHGEVFKIGKNISVTALHTPCHTRDSICYFLEDGDQRAVFTGDTLFIGGIISATFPRRKYLNDWLKHP